MKNLVSKLVMLSIFLLFSPLHAIADCAEDCVNDCDGKTGQAYEDCMVPCLQDCQKYDPSDVPDVPEPTPVEEPEEE
ncbi:MAG: hypothetical protein R2940_15265 [Syntrophotaleaceae bacterium]